MNLYQQQIKLSIKPVYNSTLQLSYDHTDHSNNLQKVISHYMNHRCNLHDGQTLYYHNNDDLADKTAAPRTQANKITIGAHQIITKAIPPLTSPLQNIVRHISDVTRIIKRFTCTWWLKALAYRTIALTQREEYFSGILSSQDI